MTRPEFNHVWAELLNVFPAVERITEATQKVYWRELSGIPSDLWARGAKYALANSQWFPTIHELGAACCGEQKAQRVWREDHWRKNNGYWRDIPEITWQQNLREVLRDRDLLPTEEKLQIEAKAKAPSSIETKLRAKVEKLEFKIDELKNEVVHLNAKLREKARVDRLAEQRERLAEQAKLLGVTTRKKNGAEEHADA